MFLLILQTFSFWLYARVWLVNICCPVDLRRVEVRGHETQFWRCQEGLPTSCLSTIEAIYYFVREYHEEIMGGTYMNEYDNLLFFFVYFYRKIREKYQGGKELKAYQRKMIEQDDQEGIMWSCFSVSTDSICVYSLWPVMFW